MAILLVLQLQPNDENLSLHRKLQLTRGVVITLEKARELLVAEDPKLMDNIPVEELKQRGALGVVPMIYQLSFSEDAMLTSMITIPPLHLIKPMQAKDNWGANWVRQLFHLQLAIGRDILEPPGQQVANSRARK
jgi:hypothetical protein